MLKMLAVLATVICSLAASAQAMAEPTVVANELAPSKVAAYGDTVVWSSFDAQTGRYSLMRLSGAGPAQRLEVRPRPVPFDVDLGLDASGRLTATYSRCAHDPAVEPTFDRVAALIVYWNEGRGCRIFLLDLQTGRERRLAMPTVQGESNYLPSLWRGRLAFAHASGRGPGALSLMDLREKKVRALQGGPKGTDDDFDGRPSPGPTSIDLRGREVLYEWRFYQRDIKCPGHVDSEFGSLLNSEVGTTVVGRRARRLSLGCDGYSTSAVLALGFNVGKIFFARLFHPAEGAPADVRSTDGRSQAVSDPTRLFNSMAVTTSTIYVDSAPGPGQAQILAYPLALSVPPGTTQGG